MARIKGKIRPPYLIAVGGFVFQLIMLAELPQLSLVVMSTILCAVLIFFTWCVKKNSPLPAKMITTGSLLFFPYFPILLSRKMWILFCDYAFQNKAGTTQNGKNPRELSSVALYLF